ncbi:alkaline phosphatase [Halalkalibacter akibai]|uniref:Alkaline phosphatase n=1 Tax=Halalkalibacter akibai (strain ATCC 43226 / DSM 21942 / CIP 109018 / JCM 9157 / 1139) TaxID=1236973 RepID=W4QXU1_HALA3|nr:alkaline phosphatase [Halalkalibacter akibai]GAE36737.1 alkaline phosphatase [Halalkalibacter akibai JCM 9157]
MFNLRLIVILVLCFSLSIPASVFSEDVDKQVENVIFMIPDGFSSSYATNYRHFKEGDFILDSMLVGMMKTHSESSWVTDSAAAATAMATGKKTANGMIGVNSDGVELQTILEAAKASGKSTGLIATKSITDATPAAFGAHVDSRQDERRIAEQLIGKVDVLLGGGKKHFLPTASDLSKRHLIEEAKQAGYTFVSDRDQLLRLNGREKRILGLFADNMLAADIDRHLTSEPSLAEMAEKAIEHLSKNQKGFFLMIEGSKIDRAGHAHDSAWAMNDIAAFEQAVLSAQKFAQKNGNTLVVVAGDHDTGGMSVGGYNQYKAQPDILREVKASATNIAEKINHDRANTKEIIKHYTGLDLTETQAARLNKANKKDLAVIVNEIINKHAFIDWVTVEHTGVDVPVYAFGPHSELFIGHQDNTDLPKKMAKAMGISLNN